MQRESKLYLQDIPDSIIKIEKYTNSLSYDTFVKNDLVIDAVIRNLEIIGEAVKNLPGEIKRKNTNIDWRKTAGIRDILIHEYFGIDLNILWDIVQNKIAPLKQAVEKLIKEC